MEEADKAKRDKCNLIINIVLMAILIVLIIVLVISRYVLSPMRVAGDSMQPTLHDKEVVFVLRTKKVARGEIAVFKHGDKAVVKRIVAVEGDSVRIDSAGIVYVNGKELFDEYILDGMHNTEDGEVEYKRGDGMCFALGDNRCNSNDSHDYGPIKRENIIGKVLGY